MHTTRVNFVDNDIVIGILKGANQPAFKKDIEALGVPLDAVAIEIGGPVILDVDLEKPIRGDEASESNGGGAP